MDLIFVFLTLTFWIFLFVCFINFYRYVKERQALDEHINEISVTSSLLPLKKKSSLEKMIHKLSKYADEFSEIGERINFFSESSEIEDLLLKSGNRLELTVSRFQGFKILLVLIGVVTGVSMLILGFPFGNLAFILFPFAGYFLPIIALHNTVKKRQEQLRKDLPDFLDTVSISLQAGSGLENAIKEIIPYYSGPLREEFSRFLYEVELGLPREIAYQHLSQRNGNEDFQSFLKSLMQGNRLGVPVSETFKDQTNEMRRLNLELVKEKAAKASPKVTLVISLIMAPTIMLFILGLVILNVVFGDNNLFTS
ncbi:type II secretion system F family protein [Sporosarcina sp. FSL K6-3457]|uniref:type II secretion system F family protein n=1 Tax=Sporosarcina sp. FSL K6-3457 TaxID=2978204 RepID=UPI0030F65DCA